jgi:hypothetical protein
MNTERNLVVSIDPGKHNGFVVYDKHKKEFICLREIPVWEVFERLMSIKDEIGLILVEDATKNWNPSGGREGQAGRAQGAGWIKRLCLTYFEFIDERLGFPEWDGTDQEVCFRRIKTSNKWSKQNADHVLLHTGVRTETNKQNLRDALMMYRYYGF